MLEARDRYALLSIMPIARCRIHPNITHRPHTPKNTNTHAQTTTRGWDGRLKAALEAHPGAAHFTEATLPGSGANATTRKSAEEGKWVGIRGKWRADTPVWEPDGCADVADG